jgi:acyl-CoA synthetase (AMP-forming)/AMP-acid ligase II
VERPATLPALLAKVVAERGAHAAIATAHETVSYEELERRTARMARALLAAGAGKGTRIGLLAPDGILWVTAFLAGLRIGALVTTISTLSTARELSHILRNSDCQFLICVRRFLGHEYAAALSAALPQLGAARAGALRLPGAPHLRSIWMDDAVELGWARPLDELVALADAPDAPDAELLAAVEREVAPGDDAVVVYTSGSTAQPKAVVHRQWTLARHSPELARNFVLTSSDRMMPLLPSFWLAGMSMMLQVLSVGGTLVYPESLEMDVVLDTIERFDVNRVNAWGDRQPKLQAAARARGMDLDRIPDLGRFRDRDGNPLPPRIRMYGMTESFSAHSAEPLDVRLPEDKAESYGRAINGYERRVVDPETGRELPPGEIGELQIRGPALMSGFYKLERGKVFTPDGFYPTRDLVRIDADGHLYPTGRRDDMIKTRGANVSRLEVEAALAALPEVALPIVASLPDPEFGQLVAAAVVPASGASPTEESLRAALRSTLSSFKIPRRIVFVSDEDVPRTATGKIQLSETARMISARIGRPFPGQDLESE